jgi:hypothetical protein
MNELANQTLSEVVARYGRSACEDPRRFRALLADLWPGRKREVNILVTALEQKIAADLLNSSAGQPWEVMSGRLVRRLMEEVAMAEDAAIWAVESWALAMGRVDARAVQPVLAVPVPSPGAPQLPPSNRPKQANKPFPRPAPPAPGAGSRVTLGGVMSTLAILAGCCVLAVASVGAWLLLSDKSSSEASAANHWPDPSRELARQKEHLLTYLPARCEFLAQADIVALRNHPQLRAIKPDAFFPDLLPVQRDALEDAHIVLTGEELDGIEVTVILTNSPYDQERLVAAFKARKKRDKLYEFSTMENSAIPQNGHLLAMPTEQVLIIMTKVGEAESASILEGGRTTPLIRRCDKIT